MSRRSSSPRRAPTPATDADLYDRVAPFWQSWHGMRRYWDSTALVSRLGPLREREFTRFSSSAEPISQTRQRDGAGRARVRRARPAPARPRTSGSSSRCGRSAVVVLLLYGGVWADRLPRHLVMVCSNLAERAEPGESSRCSCSRTTRASRLLAAFAAVNGASSAFFFPASYGIIPQTVPARLLQQANAMLGSG